MVSPVSLRDRVEAGPLGDGELWRVAGAIASALAGLHSGGVAHGAVNPGNVLLTAAGPILLEPGAPGATRSVPGYLSPERLHGSPAAPPGDVYAWAATVVYAATGRPAIAAGPELAGVPDELRPLLVPCLAPDPGDRPTAATLAAALTSAPLMSYGEAAPPYPRPLPYGEAAASGRAAGNAPAGPGTSPAAQVPRGGTGGPAVGAPEAGVGGDPGPQGQRVGAGGDPRVQASMVGAGGDQGVLFSASVPPVTPRGRGIGIAMAIAAALTTIALIAVTTLLITRQSEAKPQPVAQPERQRATPTPARSTPDDCAYTRDTTGKVKETGLPPATFDPRKLPATLTFVTNRGAIEVRLNTAKAPCAVNALAHLARKRYYVGSRCHRLGGREFPILQCGDPFAKADGVSTEDGIGTPGFAWREENLDGAEYRRGVLAMAKRADPNTTSAQFFFLYGDVDLPPDYTPVGTVIRGLTLLDRVARGGVRAEGADGTGAPKLGVRITEVRLGHRAR
ncbi:peptidylprolyl isomerase [Nonomuraea sp. NPDC050310]|uniref:peptidylprolyl isomerase n=1 Tax=Nonomuraea sp. NPDC050310 TaxID=3154935 RepID=UPI00340FB24F